VRQNLALVEVEKALLVWADLMNIYMIEAGIDVFFD